MGNVSYKWNTNEIKRKRSYYLNLIVDKLLARDDIKIKKMNNAFIYYNTLLSELYNHGYVDSNDTNLDILFRIKQNMSSDWLINNLKGVKIRDNICNELASLLVNDDFSKVKKLDIDNKQALQLVEEMIKTKLNKRHLLKFYNMFLDNNDRVQFMNCASSEMIYDNYIRDRYILLYDDSNIEKVIHTAHEAGHSYAFSMQDISLDYRSSILNEVESYFYELLMCDYLIDNNIYKEEVIKSIKQNFMFFETSALVTILLKKESLRDVENISQFKNWANKYDLYEKTSIYSTKDLLSFIDDVASDSFTYIYSFQVALEFYKKYHQNKNKALNLFDDFISKICIDSEFKLAKKVTSNFDDFNNLEIYKQYKKKILNLK